MRKVKLTRFFLILICISISMMFFAGISVQAKTTTYTYSYEGKVQISPNAYEPYLYKHTFGDDITLKSPEDITTDKEGNVYICDTGNSRIIKLNKDYDLIHVIDSFLDFEGQEQTFLNPQGIFVYKDGSIYIADTENLRIIVLNSDFSLEKIIEEPSASVLPEGFVFKPIAIAVDNIKRMNIISSSTTMGVMAIDDSGKFEGFVGTQNVSANIWAFIRRYFMSEEQIKKTARIIPSNFNNITVDELGFLYVTSSSQSDSTIRSVIATRNKASTFATVKRLTASGVDVLSRNGIFPPVGEIDFDISYAVNKSGASSIQDIALSENDVYTLMDATRNKLFTYNKNGDLLYVFGGKGQQIGEFTQLSSISYQGTKILAIDSDTNSLTVFERTHYGDLINKALLLQTQRKFSEVIPVWKEILVSNSNFDLAYVGIGNALMNEGDYTKAMENFRAAHDTENYAKAFKYYRTDALRKNAWLPPIIFILAIILIFNVFKFIKKYNKKRESEYGKHTLAEQLMYGFFVIFHPFKGFWGIKSEGRGGTKSATIFLVLLNISVISKSMLTGYLVSGEIALNYSVLTDIITTTAAVLLWCAANWCLTSLADGKGNFKDIYIATTYATIPITLLFIPASILSNFFTADEIMFYTFMVYFALFWTALLLILGMLVIHDYSLLKNVGISILTIVGMAIILFIFFLLFYLNNKVITFVQNIIIELSFM